jgi:hypothetical protein
MQAPRKLARCVPAVCSSCLTEAPGPQPAVGHQPGQNAAGAGAAGAAGLLLPPVGSGSQPVSTQSAPYKDQHRTMQLAGVGRVHCSLTAWLMAQLHAAASQATWPA